MSNDHSPIQIGLRIKGNDLAHVTIVQVHFQGGQILRLCGQKSIFLQILASAASDLSCLSYSDRFQLHRGKMAMTSPEKELSTQLHPRKDFTILEYEMLSEGSLGPRTHA